MKKRVITGTLYTLVLLAGIYFGRWAISVLISAMMLIGMHEMYGAIAQKGDRPICAAGYVYCALIIAAQVVPTSLSREIMLLAPIIGALTASVVLVLRGKIAAKELMASVFPILYPGIFFAMLLTCTWSESRSVYMLVMLISFFSASINDAAALFCGMLLGKHKLSPEISPKKTIEGSIGGLIVGTAFTMFLPKLIAVIFRFDARVAATLDAMPPLWYLAIIGLIACALSQIGDLTASMVKRDCGIKDFGKLLPGHGGIMDRVDGVLFCGAACYMMFILYGVI